MARAVKPRSVEPLNPTEMTAWRSFIRVATRALDQLDRELQTACGLSLSDYEILVALSEAPDRQVQMTELAQQALLSQSRLTYRVSRLEQEGLVERIPCEADGRRVWAKLTRTGLKRLKAAYPIHLEGVRNYVIDPPGDDDLDAVSRGLVAMEQRLDERAEPA